MNKKLCCGCRACEQICPKKCIKMIEDEEGFLYPVIEKEKCIECGLCKKVCPMLNSEEIKQKEEKKYYQLTAKKLEIIQKSSSGGAFTTIVKAILKKNQDKKYRIYGCVLEEKTVKHISINSIDEIDKFRKSKYVQSDTIKSYQEVKELLKADYIIIYTGTPCQIAGLKKFIGNNNVENLYTIDLICHGVPSPKVFSKYLESLEKKNQSELTEFNFRERMKIGNKVDSSGIKVKFKNSKEISEYSFRNPYMIGYYKGIYTRPCCEECPFANTNRVADITIGDFWGIQKIDKKLDPHTGISLCIINTLKGKEILEELEKFVKIKEADAEIAIKNNNNLSKSSKFSKNREKFFQKLRETDSFDKAIEPFIKKKSKIFFIIAANINEEMKNKIKRIVRKK